MSSNDKKECDKDSNSIDVKSVVDKQSDFVVIHYQQSNLAAFALPVDENSDIAWNAVQTFDSKILGLAVQVGERRRVLAIKNGVVEKPKDGWKSQKVFALTETPIENTVIEEANNPTTSFLRRSRRIKLQQKFKHGTNTSAASHEPCKSSATCFFLDQVDFPPFTGTTPVAQRAVVEETDAENIVKCQKAPLYDVLAAYNVNNVEELGDVFSKRAGFNSSILSFAMEHLRRLLITHVGKNVLQLIMAAKQSNLLYNKLDPTSSDFCKLCNESLTVNHILKSKHIKKRDSKFDQEVDVIFRPEHQRLVDQAKLIATTNTCRRYQNAFNRRVSNKNLKFAIDDPFFIDRFFFMRKNLQYHALPDSLKMSCRECVDCHKGVGDRWGFINHIMSLPHIKKSLTQEQLDWFCMVLSFIEKKENGYHFLLPKKGNGNVSYETHPKKKKETIRNRRKRLAAEKEKAAENGATEEDTVPKKQPKLN